MSGENFSWAVTFYGRKKKKRNELGSECTSSGDCVRMSSISALGHMAHESPYSSQHLIHTHPVPTTDEIVKLYQSIKQARDHP